jgi:hypothetical protein
MFIAGRNQAGAAALPLMSLVLQVKIAHKSPIAE